MTKYNVILEEKYATDCSTRMNSVASLLVCCEEYGSLRLKQRFGSAEYEHIK